MLHFLFGLNPSFGMEKKKTKANIHFTGYICVQKECCLLVSASLSSSAPSIPGLVRIKGKDIFLVRSIRGPIFSSRISFSCLCLPGGEGSLDQLEVICCFSMDHWNAKIRHSPLGLQGKGNALGLGSSRPASVLGI